jgi:glycosyltransferase domain-containing protein
MITDITVLIPTYNRENKLINLIDYYKIYNFPFKIIILDSSSTDLSFFSSEKLKEYANITYIKYDKEIFLTNKIHEGLKLVKTKYVVLNADDDYLVPESVIKSVNFLMNNSEFSFCQGLYISFKEIKKETLEWRKVYLNMCTIDFQKPSDRLLYFLPNYFTIFYGVYRTELLLSNFYSTIKYTDDLRFFELLPAMLTAIAGKIKIIDDLYIALEESPNSTGANVENMIDFKRNGSFDEKYNKFSEILINELIIHENIDYKIAKKLLDRAMKRFLLKKHPSFHFTFRRFYLFILNKLPIINTIYFSYNKLIEKKANINSFISNKNSQSFHSFLKIQNSIFKNNK